MNQPDLTPFGFTPTESLAYGALTQLGPLTGYALAQSLSIARANAYQALRGLVAKGAVTRTAGRPEKYRPLQPATLLVQIAQREAEQLDRLEAQLSAVGRAGAPAIVPIAGERALLDLALRTAARATGAVLCIGPGRVLAALSPAWHRRAQAQAQTSLWSVGDDLPAQLPVGTVGHLDPAVVAGFFRGPVLVLSSPDAAMVATLADSGPAGYWASDPVVVHAFHALAVLLTSSQSQTT